MGLFKKLVDTQYRELKKFEAIAKQIDALEEEYASLSDEALKGKTEEFKKRLSEGETLEDIKIEAFATAREAASRVLGEKPYFVQIVGGFAIHYGNIAEMKTGEGKTLTTVLPAYLNALGGEGVHVITTNEEIEINQAIQNGNPPPGDTELGGNIGIHGFGSESSWTIDGSISMNNVDIEEVFWNVKEGDEVLILP